MPTNSHAATDSLQTHLARYSILSLELPGAETVTAGILLEDPAADRLYVRLRRDWELLFPEEAEVLEALEDDLLQQAASGAARLLRHLEETLANTLRISERRDIIVGGFAGNFDRALGRLYRQHVEAGVQQFVTHLPRYSLAVAAGPFMENRAVEAEGWEECPPALRLTPQMFVAQVVGRSMEPLIADGSLCVFRRGVTGSRQGRMVLVEALGGGADDRYTVKRYRSEKREDSEGESRTHSIRLEPLNTEFAAWDLDPTEDRYRILAEFVQVLD